MTMSTEESSPSIHGESSSMVDHDQDRKRSLDLPPVPPPPLPQPSGGLRNSPPPPRTSISPPISTRPPRGGSETSFVPEHRRSWSSHPLQQRMTLRNEDAADDNTHRSSVNDVGRRSWGSGPIPILLPSPSDLFAAWTSSSPSSSSKYDNHEKTLDEERQEFHDQNRKFLLEAERQKSRMSNPSPPSSLLWSASSTTTTAQSPSMNSSFRKRLESIEENGWNEILARASNDDIVGMDQNCDKIDNDDNRSNDDNIHSAYIDLPSNVNGDVRINAFASNGVCDDCDNEVAAQKQNGMNNYENVDVDEAFRKHIRINSDEMSALSNNSYKSIWSVLSHKSNTNTGNHTNYLESSSASLQRRIEEFDRQQQKRFQLQKEDIGRKLFNALDHRPSKYDNDGTPVTTERQKKEFITNYMNELEKERETLLLQWKQELEEERQRLNQPFWIPIYEKLCQPYVESIVSLLSLLEVFIANLPLTIGAVGLSWVTMGVVWFKFMEENTDACIPVHFYSSQCTFPEFPGCFRCDTDMDMYKLALGFHNICSAVAGVCCVLFFLKVLLAWRVVVDELSNPTTSTPMGVICIANVCVFAGHGVIGEGIVLVTSGFHCILAFWFLYMAIFRFGLWPDPGWFPNTVGICYAAVKTWLYFPGPGMVLLAFAVLYFFTIFFISVVRVALNKKIAAPVCWIGLSAPSITLYAFTLVSQPDRLKQQLLDSDASLMLQDHDWMVRYYLPLQHFFMFLSLVGLASAVHAVITRWDKFRTKPFSPAHVAFCFPTLSHTNAVQAYRGAVNAFSSFQPGSPFKVALYVYWVAFLVSGTILNIVFTAMYFKRLPQWTKVETAGEDEPPAPEETFVKEMLEGTGAHEILDQPFVSPAVLQANEAGVLVRTRRGTEDYRLHGPYVRTRQVTALGFDPTMDDDELRRERAELLDWVARNAPRTRNRTMSNPLILRATGQDGRAIYGTFQEGIVPGRRHKRAITSTMLPGV